MNAMTSIIAFIQRFISLGRPAAPVFNAVLGRVLAAIGRVLLDWEPIR
jgi:hypothetical protein